MKQNSSLKQLMREFNTQMALKEQELTAAVKETIGERESEFSDEPLHDKTLAGITTETSKILRKSQLSFSTVQLVSTSSFSEVRLTTYVTRLSMPKTPK